MELILIRHPRPLVAPGICYGQLDLEPCPQHLEALVRRYRPCLAGKEFLTSPLTRCRKLAEKLSDGACPVDARLQELDFGDWEGVAWDAICRNQLQQWSEALLTYSAGGGENLRDLERRVLEVFQATVESKRSQVWITHAGVIRVLLAHLLNMPLVDSPRIGLDYGCVSRIQIHGLVKQVDYINRLGVDC